MPGIRTTRRSSVPRSLSPLERVAAYAISSPQFRPGATVKFRLVDQFVRGKVVEYRGRLGVGGRHLYRVEVPFDDNYIQPYDLPEEELKPA